MVDGNTQPGKASRLVPLLVSWRVPRPSGRASESEGDLGLSTLLGDGEASVVGRGRAIESATSGPCDATLVAEQVPDREPVLVSSHVQVAADNSAPTPVVTGTTTLAGLRVQIAD